MTTPALSLQLYTVREALAADLDGTLARLAAMGLHEVECFGFVDRADELAQALSRNGLRSRTGHASLLSEGLTVRDPALAGQFEAPTRQQVFTAAATLGLDIVIDPWVAAERWQTEQDVSRTAELLNAAAVEAAEYGLRVGYHNHTQEFGASIDNITAYEYFVSRLRNEVVLEVDLFWAATVLDDVPGLLTRLGNRVRALHLKDGVVGPNPFQVDAGPFDPTTMDQRPAGRGDLPLLDFLTAAPTTEFAVIEFDHYPGDIFEAVEASVSYLTETGRFS